MREVPPGPERQALLPLIRLADDSQSQIDAAIDDGTMYVVDDDTGDPVGLVLVLDHGAGARELRWVAVAEAAQRGGVGRAMLAEVAAAEHARGTAQLIVGTSNADPGNLAFYQRCGYRLLSVERDYFTPERGYPPDFTIDGLPALDMVWMDMHLA